MACNDCGYKSPEEKQLEKEGKELSYHAMTCYGHCPKCTPKKYFELKEQYIDARIDAGREWDAKFADKKKAYIEKKSASLKKRILATYNKKRPANQPELTDVSAY